jgi:Tol biopolymer transport system component
MVRLLAGATAILLAALTGTTYVVWNHAREVPPHLVKLFLPPPETSTFPPVLPSVAVSPDGRRIAFQAMVAGKRGLWVRELDAAAPRLITDGVQASIPFWAPDSRRLAFFAGDALRKIDVTGGPTIPIADTPGIVPVSGSWNQDDLIIFAHMNTALFRVPAGGGTPSPLTELDRGRHEVGHWAPWFLPDGRHFLYTAGSRDSRNGGVYVGDLVSPRASELVVPFATRAIYVAPGVLLFVRDRTLLAQPFNARTLGTTGEAVPIAEQVDSTTDIGTAMLGHFSASQNGVLVYTTGAGPGHVQLTWFDHTGGKGETVGDPGEVRGSSLSPDGASVVVARGDLQTGVDLWKRDLARGNETRLTFAGNNDSPIWSADGQDIFFRGTREGVFKVLKTAANSSGPEEVVETSASWPRDASRDYLILQTSPTTPRTGMDIWARRLDGDHQSFPYVQTVFQETWARLSPDGHWLAYQSDESKRQEIYVDRFPIPGDRRKISTTGGHLPVWSRDGSQLYYLSQDDKMMAVAVARGAQVPFSIPNELFEPHFPTFPMSFEVSQDGQFLLPAVVESRGATPLTVVLNWPELLKKK